MTKYVMVTTISTFRMRYCIPVDDLQNMNNTMSIEGHECQWAEDSVITGDVGEFSQEHVGEQIIESTVVDEEEMLRQFDADNNYLTSWTRQQKIECVRKWIHIDH